MIATFRHKGLKAFFQHGYVSGIQPKHAGRLREMLTALHAAGGLEDLRRPAWRLHPLKGQHAGFHAMTVQANWRLVFRFTAGGVELVDYLDYH